MEIRQTETNWNEIPFNDRLDVVADRWDTHRRRTVTEAWDIGRGLQSLKDIMNHGEWLPYLESIDMPQKTANDYMRLAQISSAANLGPSIRQTLAALPPKRPTEPEPTPPSAEVSAQVKPSDDSDMESAAEQEAKESQGEFEEYKENAADDDEEIKARREADGEKVQDVKPIDFQNLYKENLALVNDMRKRLNGMQSKLNNICDALLSASVGGEAETLDEVLAVFFSVKRKGE